MNKLKLLREKMLENGLDAYIVPMNDAFFSEYVPENDRRLQWLTGFTGSAGMAIIGQEKAAFFTDGRYDIQAEMEVFSHDFEIHNIANLKPEDWCADNLQPDDILGFDPWLFSQNKLMSYYRKGQEFCFNIAAIEGNLLDSIWTNKSPILPEKIFIHDIVYSGQLSDIKRKNIAETLLENDVDACIITLSESVNWLLNIRGNDLPHTPFALSYAVIYDDGKVDLYIDKQKINDDILAQINVNLFDIKDIQTGLKSISGKKIQIDNDNCPVAILDILHELECDIRGEQDPCLIPKACKNKVEILGMINAHIRDGAVLSEFLEWLKQNYNGLDEVTAADKLAEFREKQDLFHSLSFDTICGFKENGAIIHYKAAPKTAKKLAEGLLLLDSGGQYLDGTTDVTRTIYLGDNPPAQIKKHFTLVLKGHIALATAKFPIGTKGHQLDMLARQFLWAEGLDYEHGTGHGVGAFMNVHEGPQNISKKANNTPLMEGMIISNEPGFYLKNEYGIRIESLILVEPAPEAGFLQFKTLTQVPIDMNLVDKSLLTESEIKWLAVKYP